MIIRYSGRILLTLLFAGTAVLLSGCTGGGGGYSVYGGYGYPYYGHDIGYHSVYYDHDGYDSRRDRVERRREYRAQQVKNMNPEQRQQVHKRLQQTRPQRVQRVQSRRATRPGRNMGRPRGGRRR